MSASAPFPATTKSDFISDCESFSIDAVIEFVFASALSALLVRGFEFERALRLAQEFVADCVDRTERRCGGGNYGLDFESALPRYIAKINE